MNNGTNETAYHTHIDALVIPAGEVAYFRLEHWFSPKLNGTNFTVPECSYKANDLEIDNVGSRIYLTDPKTR